MRSYLLVLLVFFGVFSMPVLSHETPIALLVINERQAGIYDVEWTFSSSRNLPPPTPVFPAHCQFDYPRLRCGEQRLAGELRLLELGEKYSAAVVRVTRLNLESGERKTESYTLTGANPKINLMPGGKLPLAVVAESYIPLGFEHIMLGVDHLLFVFGLLLLVKRRWVLVKTITAFTVAHSITLAAVTLGLLGVPEQPVNALIALSIAVLAVDVLKLQRGQSGFSARLPWLMAFGFGLLHGFGFAGALTGIGLPAENLPSALLFFNVGVELGQLAFVLLVLLLYQCHKVLLVQLPAWAAPASVYAMGSIASFWFISRLVMIINP